MSESKPRRANSTKAQPKPELRTKLRMTRRGLFTLVFGLILLGVSVFVLTLALSIRPLPLPDTTSGVEIFDRHDKYVTTIFANTTASPVPLNRMSPNLQKAIMAAEDRAFYSHWGVNPTSIFRAIMANIAAMHPVQGGSTITQQLVKNLRQQIDKRNLSIKLREIIEALLIERRYSKNQILEAYLNTAYFGSGAWGAQRASERYFGKGASDLTLAEAAFLACLVTAPSELGSVGQRPKAIAHQQHLLAEMGRLGIVSSADAKAASKQTLKFRSSSVSDSSYPFYSLEVMKEFAALIKPEFSQLGYKVYTYLDPQAQQLGEKTLTDGIRKAPRGVNQGALVSISVADGGVVAMVGGVGGFQQSPWNRAISPHTAGSSFKPFVYLTGLELNVLHPDSMLVDEPLTIDIPNSAPYSPKNFDNKYLGPLTVRKALALSRNVCAVRVAQMATPSNIVTTARRAGITSELNYSLSIALGACAVSPLEMANGYACLARYGTYMPAHFIRKIENQKGIVLKETAWQAKPVFDKEPVLELIEAMQDVVAYGSGTRAKLANRPCAGKTGTADGARDIWFVGFTPDLVTATWGGNDNNEAIHNSAVTGGGVMAEIWRQYMEGYYAKNPIKAEGFAEAQTPLIIAPAFAQTPSNSESSPFDNPGNLSGTNLENSNQAIAPGAPASSRLLSPANAFTHPANGLPGPAPALQQHGDTNKSAKSADGEKHSFFGKLFKKVVNTVKGD